MGRSRSESYSDDDRRGSSEERDRKSRRDRDDEDRDYDRRRDRKRSYSRSPTRRYRTSKYRSRSRSSSPSYRSSRRYESSSSRRHAHKPKNVVFGVPPVSQGDFDHWMQLLNTVEQNNDVSFVREKYDEFLGKYPFCYGFWQKYAEFERRNGNASDALAVYTRSLLAIPLSIDLWMSFFSFMRTQGGHNEEQMRAVYERGMGIAGQEFNSDRLWLEVIAWESQQFINKLCKGDKAANARIVGAVFDELLKTPTMHTASHLARYVSYIELVEPDLLLNPDEYEKIYKLVKGKFEDIPVDQLVRYEDTQVYSTTADGITYNKLDEKVEGCFEVTVTRCVYEPDFLKEFRKEIVKTRTIMHEDTMAELSDRIPFEQQIIRPYFHVKPLEHTQLINWLAYLDFEIKRGDELRIEALFERCIITCALYEEFWIKYAYYLANVKECEAAKVRAVFKRAAVHVGCSVRLAFARSAFEETCGNFDEAVDILEVFKEKFPGYVAVDLRIAGVMRRSVDYEKSSDYSKVVSYFDKLIHSTSTSKYLSSFYAIKLARLHFKVRNDQEAAEKVLKRTIERDRDNLQLYMQLIDMAYSTPDCPQSGVCKAFDYAIRSELKIEDRLKISQRKIDYLEDLSTSAQMIEDAHEEHLQLIAQSPQHLQLSTRVNNGFNKAMMPPVAMAPMQPQWPGMQQPAVMPLMQQQQMYQPQVSLSMMAPVHSEVQGMNSPQVDGAHYATVTN